MLSDFVQPGLVATPFPRSMLSIPSGSISTIADAGAALLRTPRYPKGPLSVLRRGC